MTNIKGLDLFGKTFKEYKDEYVIIGGTACFLLFENVGLDFRATKDLDLVIISECFSENFKNTFWKFIKNGQYEIKHDNLDKPKYYRFQKPQNNDYPKMIEVFSRNQDLFSAGFLTSIYNEKKEEIESLSAIVLNDNYYSLLRKHKITIGVFSILDIPCMILFKVKAFLDLEDRRKINKNIDIKDLKKHQYDVYRLSSILTGQERVDINADLKIDLIDFINRTNVNDSSLKQAGIFGKKDELLNIIKEVFQI